MHVEHKAGRAHVRRLGRRAPGGGQHLTGQQWALDVFVAILGASGLTWVQASESQEQECWIRANEAALRYFGGRPDAIIPDNLKTGVTKSGPLRAGDQPRLRGVRAPLRAGGLPCPGEEAKGQGARRERCTADLPAHLLRGSRTRASAASEEVNQAIGDFSRSTTTAPCSGCPSAGGNCSSVSSGRPSTASGGALRDEEHPDGHVGINYHVELSADRHYYSVPYYLRTRDPKTKVKFVYDERVVAIYYENVRVAQHQRDRTPNGYTTLSEHMPDSHRRVTEWNTERFLELGA